LFVLVILFIRNSFLLTAITILASGISAQDNFAGKAGNIYQFGSTRPSFAEGNLLVPKGKAQIETAVSYNYYQNNRHEMVHPSVQIKYGVSQYFELRLSSSAMTILSPDSSITGLPPITFGLKVKMLDAKKNATGASFIGGMNISYAATKNMRPKYLAPFFRICMQQYLPENFGMMYNYGLFWTGNDAKPTYNFAVNTHYTAALKSTASKHHQIRTFLEVYLLYPHGQTPDLRANAGFAYLLNEFIQADFSVGAGLLKQSPRFIASAGLAVRFP